MLNYNNIFNSKILYGGADSSAPVDPAGNLWKHIMDLVHKYDPENSEEHKVESKIIEILKKNLQTEITTTDRLRDELQQLSRKFNNGWLAHGRAGDLLCMEPVRRLAYELEVERREIRSLRKQGGVLEDDDSTPEASMSPTWPSPTNLKSEYLKHNARRGGIQLALNAIAEKVSGWPGRRPGGDPTRFVPDGPYSAIPPLASARIRAAAAVASFEAETAARMAGYTSAADVPQVMTCAAPSELLPPPELNRSASGNALYVYSSHPNGRAYVISNLRSDGSHRRPMSPTDQARLYGGADAPVPAPVDPAVNINAENLWDHIMDLVREYNPGEDEEEFMKLQDIKKELLKAQNINDHIRAEFEKKNNENKELRYFCEDALTLLTNEIQVKRRKASELRNSLYRAGRSVRVSSDRGGYEPAPPNPFMFPRAPGWDAVRQLRNLGRREVGMVVRTESSESDDIWNDTDEEDDLPLFVHRADGSGNWSTARAEDYKRSIILGSKGAFSNPDVSTVRERNIAADKRYDHTKDDITPSTLRPWLSMGGPPPAFDSGGWSEEDDDGLYD